MIEKTISDKFFGGGLIINPFDGENIRKLDYDTIVKLFEKNGVILFRSFDIKPEEIIELTDLYTEHYAHDALRRANRMGQKLVRTVDYDSHDALLRANRVIQKEIHKVDAVKKKDEDWKVDYDNYEEMSLHSEGSYAPDYPEIIWFYCNEFSTNGKGCTTLCDGIKLWDNLSYETKNFFLLNPIRYKLKIPVAEKKIGKGTKKWLLNYQGAGDGLLDLSNGLLNITQIRFAVHPSRLPNKMCFSNHILYRDTDPHILEWGTIDGRKIPQNILDEVKEKSKKLTYDLDWKKNDFVMLDNKRFIHGRRAFKRGDKRDIMIVESSSANFSYGSTTRMKINQNKSITKKS
jgi:alpha-ketoglutarate-dependent taurine dioxygenase